MWWGVDHAGNTLRQRQNGRHFPHKIFRWIFLNENVCISFKISLKFVPKGPINNFPVSVQIMVWRRPGDKPLSEPIMVSLLTHICNKDIYQQRLWLVQAITCTKVDSKIDLLAFIPVEFHRKCPEICLLVKSFIWNYSFTDFYASARIQWVKSSNQ